MEPRSSSPLGCQLRAVASFRCHYISLAYGPLPSSSELAVAGQLSRRVSISYFKLPWFSGLFVFPHLHLSAAFRFLSLIMTERVRIGPGQSQAPRTPSRSSVWVGAQGLELSLPATCHAFSRMLNQKPRSRDLNQRSGMRCKQPAQAAAQLTAL